MAIFDQILYIRSESGTIVFISVLFFLLIFEAILHFIEKFGKEHGFEGLVEKLYREFMILGVISFGNISNYLFLMILIYLFLLLLLSLGTYILTEINDVTSTEYYISFHFAHFVMLFIALIFVLQATMLIYLLSIRKDTLLVYSAVSSDFLINEYEKLKSKPVRMFLFKNFPLFFNFLSLRENIEFKIIQAYFIRNFNLPAEFKFGNYTTQVLKNYVVELLDVRPIHWIFLSALVFLNYIRIKVLDSDNIYCGDNTGVNTVRRYLAIKNELPSIECIEYTLEYIMILLYSSTAFIFLILFLSSYYMQRLLDKVLDLEIELETKEDEEDEIKERAYDLWLHANNLECLEAGNKYHKERRLSSAEVAIFAHHNETFNCEFFCMNSRRGLYVKCLDRIRSFEVERQSELILEDNHLSPKHRQTFDFSVNSVNNTAESQPTFSQDPATPLSRPHLGRLVSESSLHPDLTRNNSDKFDTGNHPGLLRVNSARSMRADSIQNPSLGSRQRKNTHIGGTHNGEHISVEMIKKNAVLLRRKRDAIEDSNRSSLFNNDSNLLMSCFTTCVDIIGKLWDADFHRDKSGEEKLENVFNITSPATYYNFVEFSLLLQCVYMSLWATNFIGLANHSPSKWNWQIALVIPAIFNFIALRKILEFACILKSVSVLDVSVSNIICENAFNDRILLQKLRKLIKSTLKELDLEHKMWRPFIQELFESCCNEKSRFSIIDDEYVMDKDNFDLFLHSLQIRLPKDNIDEIFVAIDYDETGFLNWMELSSIVFPDHHDKGVSTVKRKHREKHDHYYTKDSIKEIEKMPKRIHRKSKDYSSVLQQEDEFSDLPTLQLPSKFVSEPSLSSIVEEHSLNNTVEEPLKSIVEEQFLSSIVEEPLNTLNTVEEHDESVDIELVSFNLDNIDINEDSLSSSSSSSSSISESDSSSDSSDFDKDNEESEINDSISGTSYDPKYLDI